MEGFGAALDAFGGKDLGPARGVLDLPQSLLVLVLRRVSKKEGLGGPLHFATVCRRFAALRFRAAVLTVRRQKAGVPGPLLADQLQVYQGPTYLELDYEVVPGLRALWRGLAVRSPVLRAISVYWPKDTCVECEGRCNTRHHLATRDSQLCVRGGKDSAWWAFSGPFLRAHAGLRSLSIRGHIHYSPCSSCCMCFGGSDSFVSAAELQSSLSRLRSLLLDDVNLGWPQDWPSALPSLKCLSLSHTRPHHPACTFPWSVLEMTGLTSLALELDLPAMLTQDFGCLVKLRRLSLSLSECDIYARDVMPPTSIWTLTGLRSLSLVDMGHVPANALRRLVNLTGLSLKVALPSMLPQDYGRLTNLRCLSLDVLSSGNAPEGTTPPASIWALTGLRSLSLRHMGRIPEEGLGGLVGLTELLLSNARLRSLPCSLQALETVELEAISGLQGLQGRFGGRESWRKLSLKFCEFSGTLPVDFGELASLTSLVLLFLEHVTKLPDNFGQLRSLMSLEVIECPLKRLCADFSQLESLTHLQLIYLHELEELPEDFGKLPCLQSFVLADCRSLTMLPPDFGLLASLTELRLGNLLSLEELPDGFGLLQTLRILSIRSCHIVRLPADFGQLASLTDLTLNDLHRFEELPEALMSLGQLRELHLQCLTGLQRSRVPGLHINELQGDVSCPGDVLPALGGFSGLKHFTIIGCGPLVLLPGFLQRLPLLQSLHLEGGTRQGKFDEELLVRIPHVSIESTDGP